MGETVIELNGKRYDAITGAYLGKSHVIPKHLVHGRVIDGFVRPSRPQPKPKPAESAAADRDRATNHAASKSVVRPPALKPDISRPKHALHGTKSLKAHQPEHSKTLMRRSVHKPEFSLKPNIKVQPPAEVIAKPQSALVRKASALRVDPDRQARATNTPKHQTVRHFRPANRPAPTHTAVAHVPVIAVRPSPTTSAATQSQQPPRTARHTDIFEAAIAHATSHQQPAHPPVRRHRRLVNTLAIIGTFLIIGGFIGYLNVPNIELRFASMQAGFHASLPNYTPTGYALQGGIKRSGGIISLEFRSGESRYVITQQASDWNSQTLLDNTIALNGPHKAVQKNGQTIYIYDGTNAAWVNGRIRYDINGNAELSADDIAAIAASL